MRKLCCGCAVIVLVTLGLVQAADYTSRHPATVMGRCACGLYQTCSNFGPLCEAGMLLAKRTVGGAPGDPEDELDELPAEPAPVEMNSPCPVEPEKVPLSRMFDPNRGRLPGKIVIGEGEEPPLATEDRLAPEPNLERLVERIEVQWTNDDAGVGQTVTSAFWTTAADQARQMPYCEDDCEELPPPMPYAEEPAPAAPKRIAPRIWNPFPPKGTEVGGHEESDLNPNGNDCREDAAAPLQLPAGPHSEQATPGEETSEPPMLEKQKSKRAAPPRFKRSFDESKVTPFAAPIKLDTMDFRPSDWGQFDRQMPPF